MIVGGFLSCQIIEADTVRCWSETTKLSVEDLDLIVLLDNDGEPIPKESLDVEFKDSESLFEMIITIPEGFNLTTIDAYVEEAKLDDDEEIPPMGQPGPAAPPSEDEPETPEELTNEMICASLSGGNWVLVPGSPDYHPQDFCIMKYEAKCSNPEGKACSEQAGESPISIAENTPWVEIGQDDAKVKCSELGSGFELINNKQWMAVTSNAASVESNWSGNSVGQGELSRGHSDNSPSFACGASSDESNAYVQGDCGGLDSGSFNQKRTMTLTNGAVVWDLPGNVREHTSYFNSSAKPSATWIFHRWVQFRSVRGNDALPKTDLIPQIAIDQRWDSGQSIGQYWAGANGSGGGLPRGGSWLDHQNSGLFSATLDRSASYTTDYVGFRCSYVIQD